jgi:hypothetical protein
MLLRVRSHSPYSNRAHGYGTPRAETEYTLAEDARVSCQMFRQLSGEGLAKGIRDDPAVMTFHDSTSMS